MTRREIVERLKTIERWLPTRDSGVHREIVNLIADLSAPPTLPEGWTQEGRDVRCRDLYTLVRADDLGLFIEVGSRQVYVDIAAVRAALELSEGA